MVTATRNDTQERTAARALARASVYRLLSQSLTFPDESTVATLQQIDLPQAQELTPHLPAPVAAALAAFASAAAGAAPATLPAEFRRIFSHVMSADCPPNETPYTARHVFQETQDLADIAGFYRAFGVELSERERPDHVGVELEFMHLLTYKEAYARVHHTAAKVRLCRDAERAFLRDHLGRWGPQFAQLLHRKAGSGYYAAVAHLTEQFLASEIKHLRVQPEPATDEPEVRVGDHGEEEGCPFTETCAAPEMGGSNVRVYSP